MIHNALLCPAPIARAEALSDDARRDVCLSDICLTSVCLSRTSGLNWEHRGLGRLKLVANVTRDSDTTFKVKRSTCRGGGILWRPPAQLFETIAHYGTQEGAVRHKKIDSYLMTSLEFGQLTSPSLWPWRIHAFYRVLFYFIDSFSCWLICLFNSKWRRIVFVENFCYSKYVGHYEHPSDQTCYYDDLRNRLL